MNKMVHKVDKMQGKKGKEKKKTEKYTVWDRQMTSSFFLDFTPLFLV